jgi:hypothetical protein
MKWKFFLLVSGILVILSQTGILHAQPNPTAPPMTIDVNAIRWGMNKTKGEGGLVNQYSWMFATAQAQRDHEFFWPQDEYLSNMLYQIFSPLALTDEGIVDTSGIRRTRFFHITNPGTTDWTWERRRVSPPAIVVNGARINPPSQWDAEPGLKADLIAEFEDLLAVYGLRAHVRIYAFSNTELQDFVIWEITLKFTGETRLPRMGAANRYPDQTIEFWWPFSLSFNPSMRGMREVYGFYGYEGEDDLTNWMRGTSQYIQNRERTDLLVAYYYDYTNQWLAGTPRYPNNSNNNIGDPDRVVGALHSTQIPGYALLYAPTSAQSAVDDTSQPFSMPHATIPLDLWGRRDFGLRDTYIGMDARGKFPPDAITAGFSPNTQKGPMRFITVGPYQLSKDESSGRFDSVTFVYAIGVGSISRDKADSVGRAWFDGEMTDAEKTAWVMSGTDSLFNTMDKAYWAWDRISRGQSIPAPPPPPDIDVEAGPDRNFVRWSYPDPSYFNNFVTGVDDWQAWRVYRKKGAFYVADPLDNYSNEQWQIIFETTNRNMTEYIDTSVERGVNYYYAVTALNDGSQNDGLYPGQPMESSRFANRTTMAATPFKPGLDETGKVRVVPNPATVAAGTLGFPGTPDKILFVNLPVKCTLSIFTETGNLIKTWEHYGTADSEWDQRTQENQYVASGIYILAVTKAEDLLGNSLPDQFEKFILVR